MDRWVQGKTGLSSLMTRGKETEEKQLDIDRARGQTFLAWL